MRKIISEEEKTKKNRTKQVLVGGILILIMFLSTAGYSFLKEDNVDVDISNKIIYNGFEFTNQNGFWFLEINGINFVFKNNPKQVINTEFDSNLLDKYSSKPVYVYSENYESEYEIYRNLNDIALRIQSACLAGQNCSRSELPLKTCEDNFILIQSNPRIKISQNKSCVFIQGPQENLTQITDGFLFKVIGVEK